MSCHEGACEQILLHIYDGPPEDMAVLLRSRTADDHVIRPSEQINSFRSRGDLSQNKKEKNSLSLIFSYLIYYCNVCFYFSLV